MSENNSLTYTIIGMIIIFITAWGVGFFVNDFVNAFKYDFEKFSYNFFNEENIWIKFFKRIMVVFFSLAALWIAAYLLGFIRQLPHGIMQN